MITKKKKNVKVDALNIIQTSTNTRKNAKTTAKYNASLLENLEQNNERTTEAVSKGVKVGIGEDVKTKAQGFINPAFQHNDNPFLALSQREICISGVSKILNNIARRLLAEGKLR